MKKTNNTKRTKPETAPVVSSDRPALNLFHASFAERWFIAVHKGGYGVDTVLAKAIRAAQESVAIDDKPSQLALYVATEEIAPTGFITWENGVKPRLVGLTNTHQGWARR